MLRVMLRVLMPAIAAVSLACAPASDDATTAADADTGSPEPDPNNPCVPGPNPSVEIGQGEFIYEPLEPGGTIELIHGPQGGVHTLTGLFARDIDGSDELDAELRGYVGDVQLGGSFPYLNFRCASDEGLQVWGIYLFWDAPPEQLHMQTVRIEAEFTDASGTVVSATTEAVIHDSMLD